MSMSPGGPQPNSSTPTSIATSQASQSTPPGSGNSTPGPQQPSGPFLRQELHHHQHQHTHLHQHQHQHQSLLPTAPNNALFPPPLFKDIPKIGAGDSPFYRTGPALVGMPPYPYGSGILHPGLSGPTQFVPPSHLQSFVPKVNIPSSHALINPSMLHQHSFVYCFIVFSHWVRLLEAFARILFRGLMNFRISWGENR